MAYTWLLCFLCVINSYCGILQLVTASSASFHCVRFGHLSFRTFCFAINLFNVCPFIFLLLFPALCSFLFRLLVSLLLLQILTSTTFGSVSPRIAYTIHPSLVFSFCVIIAGIVIGCSPSPNTTSFSGISFCEFHAFCYDLRRVHFCSVCFCIASCLDSSFQYDLGSLI